MIRVGLVGAGPWATVAMAPSLTANPDVSFVGVWARRPEAAAALADRHGITACTTYQQLLELCDAVLFCVPPDIQCALGVEAAQAGKHLLLDKPISLTVSQAETLADAVDQAGVVSQVLLTNRYSTHVRDFIATAQSMDLHGMQGTWVNGNVVEGKLFGTPWRLAEGVLFDLGPHALDLVQACVGPIVDVAAKVSPNGWAALTITHESGALSQLSLAFATAANSPVWRCEVFDASTHLTLEQDPAGPGPAIARALSEFAQACSGGPRPPIDVHHGVALQRVIQQAVDSAA